MATNGAEDHPVYRGFDDGFYGGSVFLRPLNPFHRPPREPRVSFGRKHSESAVQSSSIGQRATLQPVLPAELFAEPRTASQERLSPQVRGITPPARLASGGRSPTASAPQLGAVIQAPPMLVHSNHPAYASSPSMPVVMRTASASPMQKRVVVRSTSPSKPITVASSCATRMPGRSSSPSATIPKLQVIYSPTEADNASLSSKETSTPKGNDAAFAAFTHSSLSVLIEGLRKDTQAALQAGLLAQWRETERALAEMSESFRVKHQQTLQKMQEEVSALHVRGGEEQGKDHQTRSLALRHDQELQQLQEQVAAFKSQMSEVHEGLKQVDDRLGVRHDQELHVFEQLREELVTLQSRPGSTDLEQNPAPEAANLEASEAIKKLQQELDVQRDAVNQLQREFSAIEMLNGSFRLQQQEELQRAQEQLRGEMLELQRRCDEALEDGVAQQPPVSPVVTKTLGRLEQEVVAQSKALTDVASMGQFITLQAEVAEHGKRLGNCVSEERFAEMEAVLAAQGDRLSKCVAMEKLEALEAELEAQAMDVRNCVSLDQFASFEKTVQTHSAGTGDSSSTEKLALLEAEVSAQSAGYRSLQGEVITVADLCQSLRLQFDQMQSTQEQVQGDLSARERCSLETSVTVMPEFRRRGSGSAERLADVEAQLALQSQRLGNVVTTDQLAAVQEQFAAHTKQQSIDVPCSDGMCPKTFETPDETQSECQLLSRDASTEQLAAIEIEQAEQNKLLNRLLQELADIRGLHDSLKMQIPNDLSHMKDMRNELSELSRSFGEQHAVQPAMQADTENVFADAFAKVQAELVAQREALANTGQQLLALSETQAEHRAHREAFARIDDRLLTLSETQAELQALREAVANTDFRLLALSDTLAEMHAVKEALASTDARLSTLYEAQAEMHAVKEALASTDVRLSTLCEAQADLQVVKEAVAITDARVVTLSEAQAEHLKTQNEAFANTNRRLSMLSDAQAELQTQRDVSNTDDRVVTLPESTQAELQALRELRDVYASADTGSESLSDLQAELRALKEMVANNSDRLLNLSETQVAYEEQLLEVRDRVDDEVVHRRSQCEQIKAIADRVEEEADQRQNLQEQVRRASIIQSVFGTDATRSMMETDAAQNLMETEENDDVGDGAAVVTLASVSQAEDVLNEISLRLNTAAQMLSAVNKVEADSFGAHQQKFASATCEEEDEAEWPRAKELLQSQVDLIRKKLARTTKQMQAFERQFGGTSVDNHGCSQLVNPSDTAAADPELQLEQVMDLRVELVMRALGIFNNRRRARAARSVLLAEGQPNVDQKPLKREEIHQFLGNVELFRRLPADQRDVLADVIEIEHYGAGQVLISQGDVGDAFYVISRGRCSVTVAGESGKERVARLRQGDHFGEQALIRDESRNATVTADTAVQLLKISRERFQEAGLKDKLVFKRREAVVGGPRSVKRDTSPEFGGTEKTQVQQELIRNALLENENIWAVASLTEERMAPLVESAWKMTVPAGATVIQEGDMDADSFYIVEKGLLEVSTLRKQVGGSDVEKVVAISRLVGTISSGGSFGELALLYSAPRAATVKAKTNSSLWVVDREDFTAMLRKSCDEAALEYFKYVEHLDVFAALSTDEKQAVASSLQEMSFSSAEAVISQGDPGDCLYIVYEGELVETKDGHEIARYRATKDEACFFGAEALHSNEFLATTVTVTSAACHALSLDRDSFRMLTRPSSEADGRAGAGIGDVPSGSGQVSLADLAPVRLLGCGGFGAVELVEHRRSKTTYALKRISLGYLVKSGSQQRVLSERNCHMMCDSPFIVKLHETFNDHTKYIYFLMEAALGGELHDIYCRKGLYGSVAHAQYYLSGVVLAFEHIHARKIVYRDLKPENILLNEDGFFKLTDFGLARIVVGRAYTTCGTPEYFAPEILQHAGHGRAVDWWTLGILSFELMTGRPPFEASSPMKIYAKVKRGIGSVEFPDNCQGACADFVKDLLRAEPSERLPMRRSGINGVKAHDWFKDFDWKARENLSMVVPYKPKVIGPKDASNFLVLEGDRPPEVPYQEDGRGVLADFATSS